jgi:hypothetical protein
LSPKDTLARIINHELLLEETRYVKNLSKDIVSTKKDVVALKASKKKQIQVESSSEEEQEEDEEDEDEEKVYDEEEMALFMKKFIKYISKRGAFKGDKKEKTRSKKVCYNYDKNGHFIAQCPYERKDEDNDKKNKKDKSYKKDKKFTKKKSYGQAHVDQEWNSSDESSESKSDDLATIAIKGESSSSKSFFPNLSKHTRLMSKEGKKKVKTNAHSSPKYVTSDEDTLSSDDDNAPSDDDEPLSSEFCKNSNAMIKGLMKQVRVRDELIEKQKELLVQERKSNDELKKLLELEKSKVEKLDQENLLKARRLFVVSRAQLVLFKTNMLSCKRHIKILKCNLMLFDQVSSKHQVILKLLKHLQAKVVKDVIILILMLFMIKANL